MAAASLEGVWAKLARAQEHHDLLEQELRYFIEQDPQPIGLSIPYLDTGVRLARLPATSSTTTAPRSTTSSGSS